MAEKTEIEAKKTRDLYITKVLQETKVGDKQIPKLEFMASADSSQVTPIKWECFGYKPDIFQHIKENEGKAIKVQTVAYQSGQYFHYQVLEAYKDGQPLGKQKGGSHNYGDSPEKIANIEAQNAVSNVMRAYVKMCEITNNQPPTKLWELWDKALVWCDAKIPEPANGNREALKSEVAQVEKEVEDLFGENNGKRTFKNQGEFLKACLEVYSLNRSQVFEILALSILPTNLSEAWATLEERLTEKKPAKAV